MKAIWKILLLLLCFSAWSEESFPLPMTLADDCFLSTIGRFFATDSGLLVSGSIRETVISFFPYVNRLD